MRGRTTSRGRGATAGRKNFRQAVRIIKRKNRTSSALDYERGRHRTAGPFKKVPNPVP